MRKVVHKECGGDDIGSSTLVPRTMAISSWIIRDDGSFEPDEYDTGRDDANWNAEEPDPAGAYFCYDCHTELDEDDLEVVDEEPL